MARSEKNLTAVFTDTADAIRAKTDTTAKICPLDFADKINAIESGMKSFFDAGGKCAYSNVTTFEGMINYGDTRDVTDMSHMFENCTMLETSPTLDTSKATDMIEMFKECNQLTEVGAMDTRNVTEMYNMFENCIHLTNIPQLDLRNAEDISEMFIYCTSLTDVPYLDTSNAYEVYGMFHNCNRLTAVNLPNMPNVEDMNDMFFGCNSLTDTPAIDVGKVTNFYNTFARCSSLTGFHMTNMSADFDISASTKFNRNGLLEILNNLAVVTSTTTLTMGSTNLAKLTADDKAIATNKGWTLA